MVCYSFVPDVDKLWRDRVVEDIGGPYDSWDAAVEACMRDELDTARHIITNNVFRRRYSRERAFILLDWVGICRNAEEMKKYMGLLAFCMNSGAFHPFATLQKKLQMLDMHQPGTIFISLSTSQQRTFELWRKSSDETPSMELYTIIWRGDDAYLTRDDIDGADVMPLSTGSFFPHGHVCSICIEDFEYHLRTDRQEADVCSSEIVAVLPCNHLFHRLCIESWMSQGSRRSCPNCNGYIVDVVNSLPAGFGQSLQCGIVGYKRRTSVRMAPMEIDGINRSGTGGPRVEIDTMPAEPLDINWGEHTLCVDGRTAMFTRSEGAYDLFTVPFTGGAQLTETSDDGAEYVKQGVVLVPWHKRGTPSSSNTKLFLVLDVSSSMRGKGRYEAMRYAARAQEMYNLGGTIFPWGSRRHTPIALDKATTLCFNDGTAMSSAVQALDTAVEFVKTEMTSMTPDEKMSLCFHLVFTTDGAIGNTRTTTEHITNNLRLLRQMGHLRVSVVGMGDRINSAQLANIAENVLEAHDLMEIKGSVSLEDIPQPQITTIDITPFYAGLRMSSYIAETTKEGYQSSKTITVNGNTPVIIYFKPTNDQIRLGTEMPLEGFAQKDMPQLFKTVITTCASTGLMYTNMRTVMNGSVHVSPTELSDLRRTIIDLMLTEMRVTTTSAVTEIEHARQKLHLGIYRMILNMNLGRQMDAVDDIPVSSLGTTVDTSNIMPIRCKYKRSLVKSIYGR